MEKEKQVRVDPKFHKIMMKEREKMSRKLGIEISFRKFSKLFADGLEDKKIRIVSKRKKKDFEVFIDFPEFKI